MKRFALIMTIVASVMLFAGCEEEERYYMQDSHWILHVDGMTEGRRLTLTFEGESLKSLDGDSNTPPFYGSDTWSYYITGDSKLHIWKTETDYEGYTTTESYDLDFDVDEAMSDLRLSYKPWLGSMHKYRFDRR